MEAAPVPALLDGAAANFHPHAVLDSQALPDYAVAVPDEDVGLVASDVDEVAEE